MFTETHLVDLKHLDLLVDTPLSSIAITYVDALIAQHYARSTIERYVNCLIHFGCWLNTEGIDLQGISRAVIDRYIHDLPLVSLSVAISRNAIEMDRAALRNCFDFCRNNT
jgi:site-specific recombinase XerD